MRFSLLLLMSIITAVCVLLAMWDWYGSKWLPLAMPHVVLIGVVYWLSRKKWQYALGVARAYVGLWIATAVLGVPLVTAEITRNQDERLPDSTRVAHVPLYRQREENAHLEPWKSVGNPTVPCLFVVTIDYGRYESFGYGERAFFFVLPGRSWYLGYNFYWHST
jgi:hypothetical protein